MNFRSIILCLVILMVVIIPDDKNQAQETPIFPEWAFHLHLWPFDILYPDTSPNEIRERLDIAVEAGANSTIVYIEEEHMYGTFVNDDGFAHMLTLLNLLVDEAHARDLHVIVYLNGLEVMTHNAVNPDTCEPLPASTMARTHPDWLQYNLEGEPVVYSCLDSDWVTPDMEDAWVSPFSPYRDLFRTRIEALGNINVDGVYIDATFMPGLQLDDESPQWGTTDPIAQEQFQAASGYTTPDEADWDNPAWREWLLWRHEVIRDYLGEMAATAWNAGMVPFWESSTNDTPDSTLLANETAVTAQNSMGFSPEIEPEGDWLAAFRMMHSARDFAPEHPLIYLGWPETFEEGQHEFATALSFSNILYPTADAPYPDDASPFARSLEDIIVTRRQPYFGHIALIYSVRNKDWTYEDSEHFEAYDDAFRDLTKAHIPFRILVLENLTVEALEPFDTVILPNVISISDAEYALLRDKNVVVSDWDNGLMDKDGNWRDVPLEWPHLLTAPLDELPAGLPFDIVAPETTYIAFYQDGNNGFFLFAAHEEMNGEMMFTADSLLNIDIYRRGESIESLNGDEVMVLIEGELTVLHITP